MMRQSWLRVWFGFRALENCSHSLDMLCWSWMRLILWHVEKTAQFAEAEKEEIERKRSERAKRRKECQQARREKLEGEDWANPYESIRECQRGMNWVWYLHCMALRFPGLGGWKSTDVWGIWISIWFVITLGSSVWFDDGHSIIYVQSWMSFTSKA